MFLLSVFCPSPTRLCLLASVKVGGSEAVYFVCSLRPEASENHLLYGVPVLSVPMCPLCCVILASTEVRVHVYSL